MNYFAFSRNFGVTHLRVLGLLHEKNGLLLGFAIFHI
jgi:hypothetical protein